MEDGCLRNHEFISVMKERLGHGLQHPKDTGFYRLVQGIVSEFLNEVRLLLLTSDANVTVINVLFSLLTITR